MKIGLVRHFFTLLWYSVLAIGCAGSKKAGAGTEVEQGIKGFVGELVGNQMPGPGRPAQAPRPVSTTVYIYEATTLAQVDRRESGPFYDSIRTRLVKTVVSDTSGQFLVALPEGNYSLFTKVDGRYYANLFDAANTIAPARVEAAKLTEVKITISANASF